jgi:hypothetical protein
MQLSVWRGSRWTGVLEVNERLCDILGYTSDELLTKTFDNSAVVANLMDVKQRHNRHSPFVRNARFDVVHVHLEEDPTHGHACANPLPTQAKSSFRNPRCGLSADA